MPLSVKRIEYENGQSTSTSIMMIIMMAIRVHNCHFYAYNPRHDKQSTRTSTARRALVPLRFVSHYDLPPFRYNTGDQGRLAES